MTGLLIDSNKIVGCSQSPGVWRIMYHTN